MASTRPFPFSAIVGQDRLKGALVLAAVCPRVGGVLLRGERGSAKSVATQALVHLMPEIEVVEGSPYNCQPDGWLCPEGQQKQLARALGRVRRVPPLVEVPLSVTEERLAGYLDTEAARRYGLAALQPGLLARAHRGVLFLDQVNLMPPPLLDLVLTAHQRGVNQVERGGVSVSHPCEFLLVASMCPDEGELPAHALDRFALIVVLDRIREPGPRAEILNRCLEYDSDPEAFTRFFAAEETRLARRVVSAQEVLGQVSCSREMLEMAVNITASLESPGHRADLALLKVARVLAALEDLTEVEASHLQSAASLVLPYRMGAGAPSVSEVFRRDYFTPSS